MHNATPVRDWLAQYEHRDILSLYAHWRDHRGEFPELRSAEEYEVRANEFVNSFAVDPEIEYVRLKDSSIYLYKRTSNELAIIGTQGNAIVSYFKPEDRLRYWRRLKMKHAALDAILDEGRGG